MDHSTDPYQHEGLPSAGMVYQLDPSAVQTQTSAYNTDHYQPPSPQTSGNPSSYPHLTAPRPTNPAPPQATFINQEGETPPLTPKEEDQQTVVSVSTGFHPGSHSDASDRVFCTTDSVMFYVNARTIQKASRSAFTRILHAPITSPAFYEQVINVPDASDVFNVILHCLYNTSFAQNSPTFDTLERAIDRMPFYSIVPSKHIFSGTPCYTYILSLVALHPLRIYALAAHHHIEELAVVTSSHLLGVPLSSIGADTAEKMGAVYLNRLVCLIVSRLETLKNLVLTPPVPHPATRACTFEDQKGLERAWALAAAYLVWEVRPDISTYSLRAALNPLLDDLTCEDCIERLRDRIRNVVTEWANAPVRYFLALVMGRR